jgi:hypothetical protein
MTIDERLANLIAKWTADRDGYKSEARHLEMADRSRHATSIVMLGATVQAIDRCIRELEVATSFN